MKNPLYIYLFLSATICMSAQTNVGISGHIDGVSINEFHYDNKGRDLNEFVEIVGPSGTDLSGYTLTLYNGADNKGIPYKSILLSGIIPDERDGVGTLVFEAKGLQNDRDGLTLSKEGVTDIQFLSYEGDFVATKGLANGVPSVDVGVEESKDTETGKSLEIDRKTYIWKVATASPGKLFETPNDLATPKNTIEELALYPNPTTLGYINISSNSNAEMNAILFDLLGNKLFQKTIEKNHLDVSDLRAGIYFLRVTQEGKSSVQKILIN